ncbi:MAG: ABC transporter permease, partial [Planctomycetes bacterium]|nr:ABC transporter permease [Planctomycetota bacterium]
VTLCMLGVFAAMIVLLVIADVAYLRRMLALREFLRILVSQDVLGAMQLSLVTSLTALALVIVFSIPVGYALSRCRFRGHTILNAIVDVPIVLPPVVIGVSLLAVFGTGIGRRIVDVLEVGGISLTGAAGIVLCQFLISVSYSIRAAKASFDAVDRSLEHAALVLGCTHWQAFRRVTIPMAAGGLVAGAVMAWARAIGVFGPLMVFVGTSRRVLVMPTAIWLELSVGNIEVSLAVAMVMLLLALCALIVVHRLAPGRRWT